MKYLFYIVFVFYSLNYYSQVKFNPSEFERKRNKTEELSASKLDSASQLASQLMELARQSNSKEYLAKAASTVALVKINTTEFDQAKALNDMSLATNKLLKNEDELAKNYFNYALIYQRKSNFVNSVNYFFKTINLAEKTKNYILIQKSYRGLSMSYCDQKNYEKALEFGFKALKVQKTVTNTNEKAFTLAAIGEIYRLKNNLILSNTYFEKAYKLFKIIKNEHGIAWVLTNWSLCYEDDYLKLTDMELEAQEIWDRIAPENMMSITNLGNLAYTYFDFAKSDSLIKLIQNPKIPKNKSQLLDKAESYYSRCLGVARKKKNLNSLQYYSGTLAELQAYRGDHKKAYENLKLRNELNDSIYSQKNKNKIAAYESAKKIELRDKQIQLNKLTLAAKEKQKWYFVGGILLLAIIGSLLFYQSSNRRKTNEKLQLLNTELDQANKAKTRFFSILNHDLRGPVANLVFFLQLQKESPELLDEESTKRMQDKTMAGAENLLNSMEDILQKFAKFLIILILVFLYATMKRP